MTRAEEGYAYWKEDPKMVAAARVQAKGAIGRRVLRQMLVESWVRPAVEWITRTIESSGKGAVK